MIKFIVIISQFKSLTLKIILPIFCLLLSSCSYFNDSYKPAVLSDQKVLSSRKAQIQVGRKIGVIGIATYLNNVLPDIYKNGEYFFLELFSEMYIPLVFMDFNIIDNSKIKWVREVSIEDFDEVINVYNKWSRGYLISFDEVREQNKKNMKLHIDIANIGSMDFDFTYKVLENQF